MCRRESFDRGERIFDFVRQPRGDSLHGARSVLAFIAQLLSARCELERDPLVQKRNFLPMWYTPTTTMIADAIDRST